MKREARRLRVWRAEQNVRQYVLARQAGLSRSRYWQIENGEGSEPSDDERRAVAAALGVKVSDIEWPELAAVAS